MDEKRDEKTFHDLVQEILDVLFNRNPQAIVNWVNKKRREGWALGEAPLGGVTKKEEK